MMEALLELILVFFLFLIVYFIISINNFCNCAIKS